MSDVPIVPLEYKVLVEVNPVSDKSSGGIFLPESSIERQENAREVGRIVAIGSMAFTEPDWPVHPQLGDFVLFNRYAGSMLNHSGKKYRLVNDKDLGAIVTDEFREEDVK